MKAIVLARRDFREYDQIISFYTEEIGKVELLARGIKKITSKQSAHAEPFSLVDLDIARGKEIDHLIGITATEIFPAIRADWHKSVAAGYAVSITDKLLEIGLKDEKVFNLLAGWLGFLAGAEFYGRSLLDGYIVGLLNCLGLNITATAGIPIVIAGDLAVLASGDWPVINRREAADDKTHDFIYQFVLFHGNKKAADWKFNVKN